MEMTYEKWQRKQLRRRFSPVGWILLVYSGIMNICVLTAMFLEPIFSMMHGAESWGQALSGGGDGAWGYFATAAIGLLILLCWKKPSFWKNTIWEKGKAMTVGSFFEILCIFISGQAVFQLLVTGAELFLNTFGLSIIEGLNELSIQTDSFPMFLYAGVLAPITEEILFRGLIQKPLMPYGRRFAILCSAFAFGLFHGSLLQSVYAFAVGLVLGYVASEYSIAWAMVLHMFNNLVVADILYRLTAGMPGQSGEILMSLLIWFTAIAAIIIVVVQRKKISDYFHREKLAGTCCKCFFSSFGMIVFIVVMALSTLYSLALMIRPL